MGRVGRNGSEQYVSLYLFLGLLQRILDWKEAIIGFSNFLKIFAIFLEFSFTRWVGTKRNDNFYFLYFDLKWSLNGIFWFFFFFFLEFFITRWVWTERKDIFYSLFLGISQPILAWNDAIMVFINFLNLFANFLEFSITRRVGMKRNDNFYFLSFSAFSNLFRLEIKPYG